MPAVTISRRTIVFSSVAVLAGCAEVGLQERSMVETAADAGIRAQINQIWLRNDKRLFVDLNLQVFERRVLLSGAVTTEDARADAIRLTWQANGLREVINEIDVTDEGGLGAYARDTAIVTQLNTWLLTAKGVHSLNYSVEAVNKTVFLLGVAQDQDELDRVLNYAKSIASVRRVANYVLLRTDPRRFAPVQS